MNSLEPELFHEVSKIQSSWSDAVVQLWPRHSPVLDHLFSHFFLPEFTPQASRSVHFCSGVWPWGGQRDRGSAALPEPAGGRDEGEPGACRLLLRPPPGAAAALPRWLSALPEPPPRPAPRSGRAGAADERT